MRHVDIIGVPIDLGANIRGANLGPASLRIAGVADALKAMGLEVTDHGDIPTPVRETLSHEDQEQRYLGPITSICERVRIAVLASLRAGHLPITLGGDHSLAVGSITGVAEHFAATGKTLGVIWIDAHADLNTPSVSPTGNIHGMPLAALLGEGHPTLVDLGTPGAKLAPQRVALIGIRDLDRAEKEAVRRSGIHYFSMREIDERGMRAVMEEALHKVNAADDGPAVDGLHLSFDLDGIDPSAAPGVSTAVPGGLTYREAHLALEMLADTGLLASLDMVELNPMYDTGHTTARLCRGLIESALGKAIV